MEVTAWWEQFLQHCPSCYKPFIRGPVLKPGRWHKFQLQCSPEYTWELMYAIKDIVEAYGALHFHGKAPVVTVENSEEEKAVFKHYRCCTEVAQARLTELQVNNEAAAESLNVSWKELTIHGIQDDKHAPEMFLEWKRNGKRLLDDYSLDIRRLAKFLKLEEADWRERVRVKRTE